jgi:hypothetical protein
MWNVRSVYTAGFLMTVAKEISEYKLILVGVQEVRWDIGGTEQAGEYTFLYGKGNRYRFFVHKRLISAVKRVEFVIYRVSYIIIRGHWCDIFVMNVHVPTKDKTDDMKDSFCKEQDCTFSKFPKYHMKILLGDCIAKVGRKDISRSVGNESLCKISNDNGVKSSKLCHI